MKRTPSIVCGMAIFLVTLTGCDDGSSNPPPSAAPTGGGLSGLTETPSSLAGRSAAAGRNAARLAEQGQQQASGLADELSGKAEGTVVSGIEFAVPVSWEKATPRQFQNALYVVGEGAEVSFSGGIGGGVESNINRWRQQVTNEGGSPADAKVEKRTIGGMPATVVSMEGTYTPMSMAGPGEPITSAAFRGVIYSGPGGDVFVRFTGPKAIVEANKAAWETMVLGAKRQ
jgi:hypothetical protein